jgi:hypothetical protein
MRYASEIDNELVVQDRIFAAADARRRNALYEGQYTAKQRAFAEAFRSQVANAYVRSRVYLNYRERFMAIKVERPSVRDRISSAVAGIEDFCSKHGITAHRTASAIVFRISA